MIAEALEAAWMVASALAAWIVAGAGWGIWRVVVAAYAASGREGGPVRPPAGRSPRGRPSLASAPRAARYAPPEASGAARVPRSGPVPPAQSVSERPAGARRPFSRTEP